MALATVAAFSTLVAFSMLAGAVLALAGTYLWLRKAIP